MYKKTLFAARWVGISISDFRAQYLILPLVCSSVGENALLIKEVRKEWSDLDVTADISLLHDTYNYIQACLQTAKSTVVSL